MHGKRSGPDWRLIGAAACLFVFALAAPRSWNTPQHWDALPPAQRPQEDPVAAGPRPQQAVAAAIKSAHKPLLVFDDNPLAKPLHHDALRSFATVTRPSLPLGPAPLAASIEPGPIELVPDLPFAVEARRAANESETARPQAIVVPPTVPEITADFRRGVDLLIRLRTALGAMVDQAVVDQAAVDHAAGAAQPVAAQQSPKPIELPTVEPADELPAEPTTTPVVAARPKSTVLILPKPGKPAPNPVRVSSSSDRLAMRNRPAQPSEPAGEYAFASDDSTFSSDDNGELAVAEPQTAIATDQPLVIATDQPVTPAEPHPRSRPAAQPKPVPAADTAGLLPEPPVALMAQLRDAASIPASADWAARVSKSLHFLTSVPQADAVDAGPALDRLAELAAEGRESALEVVDPDAQQVWMQAASAIDRRLGVWRPLLDPAMPPSVGALSSEQQEAVDATLRQAIAGVAELLAKNEAGAAWQDYLLLDELSAWASPGMGEGREARREIALRVLNRLTQPGMDEAQRRFVRSPRLQELGRSLQPWLAGPVRVAGLATLIEYYESGKPAGARGLGIAWERLSNSADPAARSLADHLGRHYRGGNVRLAVSADLLNRLVPPVEPSTDPVRGEVAGAPVRGRSTTTTKLRVDLKPDEDAWRLGLVAQGEVRSRTRSETWPALLRNSSFATYQVEKVMTIDPDGVRLAPATASAKARNRLVGVETRFDGVPLLGAMVRDAARDQHRRRNARARSEVQAKVARQARSRMNSEADPKLLKLEQKFFSRVLGPLGSLALVAEPVEMKTTEERVTMRLRVADERQLAAHTARPAAPSDSLASLQVHESAFNNAAEGLSLAGRKMTAPELFDTLVKQLHRDGSRRPSDLPERATITFPKHDPVVIRCDDDRVTLTLSIQELRQGRDKIRGFQVHARFKPVVDGLQVKLVRDGSLQFSGRRILTGPRIVLHSVFGKLIRKDQEFPVITAGVHNDPRLKGMMVTQLVIDDGWVALALGPHYPQRVAWRTRPSAVPSTAWRPSDRTRQ
ncbi:MAG: hypothetical protein AAGA92_01615 [Planctomycetota bacterium]